MNSAEDWDVIWKWHWFRRQLWQPHYRDANHAEGRIARKTPMLRQVLQQYGATRVLDANCGLGLRALLLNEAGFDVTGTDVSPLAIRHAIELAEFHNQPVHFETCTWDLLGERFHEEFDAVLTDGIGWIRDLAELQTAFNNFAAVLKPGGVVLFAGIDQWSPSEARFQHVEHAWKAAPRFQIRASFMQQRTHMTLVVARDREELAITENYLFVIHEDGTPRLETASIRTTLEWTWADFENVCNQSGFASVRTIRVLVGSREHHMNAAHK